MKYYLLTIIYDVDQPYAQTKQYLFSTFHYAKNYAQSQFKLNKENLNHLIDKGYMFIQEDTENVDHMIKLNEVDLVE